MNQTEIPGSEQTLPAEIVLIAAGFLGSQKADAKEIVGLIRHSGKVDGYQLSDHSTVSKAEGVQMAKNGDVFQKINSYKMI